MDTTTPLAARLLERMDHGQTLDRDTYVPLTDWPQAERLSEQIVALRRARGDRPIGWKIGLTNASAWPRLGIDRPLWGRLYDRTVTLLDAPRATLALAGLSQPRIEPEIVFGLAHSPASDAPADLLAATAWIAHGFEIVHTPYPGWQSTPYDSHAAQGMHAALIVGPRLRPQQLAQTSDRLMERLAQCQIEMSVAGGGRWAGTGAVVLGSPLLSLGRFVRELADRGQRLGSGEMITTGTLTDAQALTEPGVWTTRIEGLALPGLELTVR